MKLNLTAKQRVALDLIGSEAFYIMLHGGSRSGKTYILCCSIIARAAMVAGSRHAIIRQHFDHVKRSIGMDIMPKALNGMGLQLSVWEVNKQDWIFKLANGSEVWLVGLDDAERAEKILGNEFSTLYFNEASQTKYAPFQLAITRAAQKTELRNKVFIDCNPPGKKHWLYGLFFEHKNPNGEPIGAGMTAELLMNPDDNAENLPKDYIETVLGSLSQRQQQRFKLGMWLDEIDGALWKFDMMQYIDTPPHLDRIVVAIDPAVSTQAGSDETGIIVAGRKGDEAYVLEDLSGKYSPLEWARVAVNAFHRHKANIIVGEKNQGGDLIESNLRTVDKFIPYKGIHATKGKYIRAEPVAALYEQKRVFHKVDMPFLENQMIEFKSDVNRSKDGSPDRVDALVWAITELMLGVHAGSFTGLGESGTNKTIAPSLGSKDTW